MPIFHDDSDEVTWLPHHHEPAPPPPPFEPPPERPLFAPDPADGQPARRPRRGPGAGPAGRAAASGPGRAPGPVPAPAAACSRRSWTTRRRTTATRPGTSMLRLALIVAVCLLLLIGCVIAFNLGRGRTPLGAAPDDPDEPATSGQSSLGTAPPAAALTGVTATDFDPQGNPPEENPEEAPPRRRRRPGHRLVDARPTPRTSARSGSRPASAWSSTSAPTTTSARSTSPRSGRPTQVQVYVTSQTPTEPPGRSSVAGQTTVTGTHGAVDRWTPPPPGATSWCG